MASIQQIIEGAQIIAKYLEHPEQEWIAAEHDIIYFPEVEEGKMSEEDKQRLDELGFHEDSECDCWARFT